MRIPAVTARTALVAVAVLAPQPARATERQLQLAARLGFGSSSGPRGGVGGVGELTAGYGLNDAFAAYAAGGYSLSFPAAPASPRHAGSLAVGVFYLFDYVRIVPYAGLGVRGDVVATPAATYVTPSAEVRGGVSYLLNRTFALDLQAAYAFPFLQRDQSADFVTVAFGVQYLRDL